LKLRRNLNFLRYFFGKKSERKLFFVCLCKFSAVSDSSICAKKNHAKYLIFFFSLPKIILNASQQHICVWRKKSDTFYRSEIWNRCRKNDYYFSYTSSDRKKCTLRFVTLTALQFWEMALVFHYYLEKFGLNIFPDLKNKQIKYKKPKFAQFFVILNKIKFSYTL